MGDLSLTVFLIIITTGISLLAFRNYELLGKLLMTPHRIARYREYWRFLTSGFIHADFMHLLFNMLALLSFGSMIESIFLQIGGGSIRGQLYYLALYLGGIVLSDYPAYKKNINNPHYSSLGASGGVSSVVFSAILFAPTAMLSIYGIIPIPAILFAVLYVWYSIAMSRRGGDNVNHDAHLYGALYGVVFTTLVYPDVWKIFLADIQRWIQ